MPTGHAKATVGSTVLAEADTWEEVEGNVYFPPSSVKTEFFTKTEHSTHCPWKGDASYYTIEANGEACARPDNSFDEYPTDMRGVVNLDQELQNAAWYYPAPKEKANNIKDFVAFCK